MPRRTVFLPYQPKTILNKGQRADHWFWTRYSAYPYTGCQHGCEFCYCRERKFCPHDDPLDFPYVIRVKENAPALLRRALARAPRDVIGLGDYQPAERKYRLTRQMLEVCLELGFPVFILSRSPLVLRDLDLLQAINERARAVVAFSAISAPGSPSYDRVCAMERLAPRAEKRFAAMAQIAAAGIVTGTCCMPILPGVCDSDANLAAVVHATADHGGRFVLAGGLTLADQQRDYFLGVLRERFPDLVHSYEHLYPEGSYGPAGLSWPATGRRIRALCREAGIADRMPRPIIPGKSAPEQAGCRSISESGIRAGIGRGVAAADLGLPQSCLGGGGYGAGHRSGVPHDGAARVAEHPGCGAGDGRRAGTAAQHPSGTSVARWGNRCNLKLPGGGACLAGGSVLYSA